MTIRNVVMGRLRDDADRTALEAAIDGILALDLPGLLSNYGGFDLGLRDGGWSFSITNDWADAASYRAYDLDAEHNVHRAVIVAQCEQLARVQFPLDG